MKKAFVIGAMLGAVLIGTLEQSLFRLQISQFWLDALLGLLILLAVASAVDGGNRSTTTPLASPVMPMIAVRQSPVPFSELMRTDLRVVGVSIIVRNTLSTASTNGLI